MGAQCIEAELLKMMSSIRGIKRASKKDIVKSDFFSLQVHAENVVLSSRGLQLVSRLCIFTVLYVCFPLASIELCAHLHWVVLGVTPGANEEWLAI